MQFNKLFAKAIVLLHRMKGCLRTSICGQNQLFFIAIIYVLLEIKLGKKKLFTASKLYLYLSKEFVKL